MFMVNFSLPAYSAGYYCCVLLKFKTPRRVRPTRLPNIPTLKQKLPETLIEFTSRSTSKDRMFTLWAQPVHCEMFHYCGIVFDLCVMSMIVEYSLALSRCDTGSYQTIKGSNPSFLNSSASL